MIDAALISKVKTLSPKDRLELIGAVWESLDQSTVSVSSAERELLDARLKDLEENPSDQSPWPEVKARLRKLVS
jgi:putative addiction module component (TIGR02574 family)